MNSGRFDEIVSWRRWSGPPSPPATPPPPTGCHPGPLGCGGCSIRSRQRWRPPQPRSSRVERTSPRPNRPPVSLPRAILPQAACARSICPAEPEPGSGDDLPWWLMTQFLEHGYQGSLSEISELPSDSPVSRVLANSAVKPWEPSPWNPPKSLDFISGYSSNTGVPLVIEEAEYPWTMVIGSVESEMRYLRSRNHENGEQSAVSALALPFVSTPGYAKGSSICCPPG